MSFLTSFNEDVKRIRSENPHYFISIGLVIFFIITGIASPAESAPFDLFLLMAALIAIADLFSIQVSEIQAISPAAALIIYLAIVYNAALAREAILVGFLITLVAILVFPQIRGRSALVKEQAIMLTTGAAIQLTAVTMTEILTIPLQRLLPFTDINIFTRTLFFTALFLIVKALITLSFFVVKKVSIHLYLERNLETIVKDGLISNLFTTVAILSLLVVTRLLSTAYMRMILVLVVTPLFILGAYLLRNRHVISRRLSHRVRDLVLLNTLIQRLSANLDPGNLVEAIYREITMRLNVQGFYIGLHDARKNTLSYPIVYEKEGRVFSHGREFGDGLTEYIITHHKALILNEDPLREAREMGLNLHYREVPPMSYLGVPISYEDRVLGVMAVRHYERRYAFDEEDQQLMETIASAAGVALQNSRQYTILQRQTRELTTLSQITSILEGSTGLQEFVDISCASLLELTHARAVAVTFLDPGYHELIFHHARGLPDNLAKQYLEVLLAKADEFKAHIGTKTHTHIISNSSTVLDPVKRDWLENGEFASAIELLYFLEDVGLAGSILITFDEVIEHEHELVQIAEIVGSQITVAFSNARLLNRVFDRNEELELLTQASTEMIQSLSVRRITASTANYIFAKEVISTCDIWLVSDESHDLRLVDGWKRTGDGITRCADLEAESIPLNESVLRLKEPVPANDHHTGEEGSLAERLKAGKISSATIYPLRMEDRLVGIIVTGSEQDDIKAHEKAYLQVIANQAAAAIANAKTYERTESSLKKRLEELESLEKIMYRITLGQSLAEVAHEVVRAAYINTGAELIELLRYEGGPKTLHLIAQIRHGVARKTPGEIWNTGEGLIGTAIEAKQLINIVNVDEDERYRAVFEGTRSEMVVPLVLDDETIGVLNLESRQVNAFNAEEERFITNLARQAAIAFQNLAMLEQVSQQAEEFRALRNIAIGMLSSKDLDEMLHMIVQQAVTYTNAENIHIYLFDNGSDRLEFGASCWRSGEVDRRIADPEEDDLPYQVVHTGKPMYTANKKEKLVFNNAEDLFSSQETGTDSIIIGIPLRQGEQVIGAFDIVFDTLSFLSEESLHFLELLAAQAAEAITKVRYEETVRNTRDRLQAILDSTSDGIAMFDWNGYLVTANRQVMDMLSLDLEEDERTHFTHIFKEEVHLETISEAYSHEAINSLFRELRDNPSRSTRREYRLSTSGATIEEISHPVFGESKDPIGWIFIFRDITQQKELDAYRQDMSNMIVHDLRSPLSSVITGLQMALSEILVMPEADNKHFLVSTLSIASQSANALLELVENLLDVNKLESGQMPLVLSNCSLSDIIYHARLHLNTIFQVEEIEFLRNEPADLPLILADEVKIERVMINLLDNCLHFTPRHGTIQVSIKKLEDGSQQVTVSDTGPGIAPEMREAIFERFAQDKSRHRLRGGRGSGLGLTFCKLAVEAHGGRIWAGESELGGATIHFTLPASAAPSQPSA